jgi:hypothetical protein
MILKGSNIMDCANNLFFEFFQLAKSSESKVLEVCDLKTPHHEKCDLLPPKFPHLYSINGCCDQIVLESNYRRICIKEEIKFCLCK